MKTRMIRFISLLMVLFLLSGILAPITPAAANTAAVAHVKWAHLASFANTVNGTSVTVNVDGLPVLTNFKFGDLTAAYVDITAGVDHPVEVVPTAGGTALITQTINLTADTFYTIAAIGNTTLQKLELALLVDDNTRPASGARVRVAHFAALSSISAETRLDVCDANNQPLPGLSGIAYKFVSDPYLNLPAGVYHLKVSLAGLCSIFSYPIPPFILYDYTVLSVFAAGDLVNLQPGVGLRLDQPPILSFIPIIIK
jgi:hypothetical protein